MLPSQLKHLAMHVSQFGACIVVEQEICLKNKLRSQLEHRSIIDCTKQHLLIPLSFVVRPYALQGAVHMLEN